MQRKSMNSNPPERKMSGKITNVLSRIWKNEKKSDFMLKRGSQLGPSTLYCSYVSIWTIIPSEQYSVKIVQRIHSTLLPLGIFKRLQKEKYEWS